MAFVIFYDLGDAVIGVAAGVPGWHASQLPPDIQSGRVEAIHFEIVGKLRDASEPGGK